MLDLRKIWEEVSSKLRGIIANDDVFASYIAVNRPVSIDDAKLVLEVDSAFLRDWVENSYKDAIIDALTVVMGKKLNVEWVVANTGGDEKTQPKPAPQPQRQVRRGGLCIGTLNPDYTFDEFVVGASNSFTHSAAIGVTKNPGTAYNPLFIYGDTGLGKTHIMQAVGHELLKQRKKVAYVTSEQLFNEFLTALQSKQINEFRDKYRKVDILLIDDIQFFAGKPTLQEEFFHTFNALYQAHKQIIITSDKPSSEVAGLEKRLVSRFNAGLTVEMESPNSEMRLAILRYKLAHRNVSIPEEVERFIAENVKSNVRNLEGAMNIVIANMNMDRNVVLDIPQVRRWLHDLIDEDQKDNVTADSIRKAVCEFFKVNIDDLNKDTRIQSIVVPRQIAMYLCRVLLKNSSLPSIAKTFDRTHANIYFACTKMKKLYRSDETTRGNIHEILGLLGKTDADLDIEETDA